MTEQWQGQVVVVDYWEGTLAPPLSTKERFERAYKAHLEVQERRRAWLFGEEDVDQWLAARQAEYQRLMAREIESE